MVKRKQYSTYIIAHSAGAHNPEIGEYFFECNDDFIPTHVIWFVRLLKKLGRFHAGQTVYVRMDECATCEMIDRRATRTEDFRSKTGGFTVYRFSLDTFRGNL